MWNLPQPDVTQVRDHLDTVFPIGVIPAVVTEDDKDAIEGLYLEYQLAMGRPEVELIGDELSAELKEAVRTAYGEVQENGKLSLLRDALKLLAIECPYCGFGQIQDLDHHLPKAVFKPFAIYPLNLVPCCTTCNRGKPRKPRLDPETDLLHAYLEDVSNYDFFVAKPKIDPASGGMTVNFYVVKAAGMGDELHARLINQVEEYDLHERYPAQINIYLSGLETAFEQAFNSGGASGLKEFLERSAERNSNRFGANDWRTALLKGLADSAEFCNGGFVTALGR